MGIDHASVRASQPAAVEHRALPLDISPRARPSAFSSRLRGTLREQLVRRPGRRARSGTFLYLAGEPATSLFYLRRGLVKTSRVSPDGRELILRIHRPGEIFGELCLCPGGRRDQAATLEPSEIVEMPRDQLLAQLRSDPDALLELMAVACERLDDAHARLQGVAFQPAMERLVRALLAMPDLLGELPAGSAPPAHHITQAELAQLIGARREVVSGLLNRLREQGLIEYPRKGRISVRHDALKRHLDTLSRPADL